MRKDHPSSRPRRATILLLLLLLLSTATLAATSSSKTMAAWGLSPLRPAATSWSSIGRRRLAWQLQWGRRERGLVCLGLAQQGQRREGGKHVTIVGGGLAGLSTAWHLATAEGVASITILDPRPPGQAEASSVAGGLLHPLTPKSKLIWTGLKGFEATSILLAASKVGEKGMDIPVCVSLFPGRKEA